MTLILNMHLNLNSILSFPDEKNNKFENVKNISAEINYLSR